MRRHSAVSAAALAAAALAATPGIAGAAAHPVHNHELTIHVTKNHIDAGDPVDIFGRLEGRSNNGQTIQLYHRIDPAAQFTLISTTKTDAAGRYVFVRADGIVETNRNWFVRGPLDSHSKTIHERVAAEVSPSASSLSGTTRHPLTFTGTVTPDHTGEPIALQVQRSGTDGWTTVKTARIGAGSQYSISYGFRTGGARNVRTVFRGDVRNTSAASNPVAVVIQQHQAPYATINSSDPIAPNGTPVQISGTFDQSGTASPLANAGLQLYAATPGTGAYHVVQNGMTMSDGTYSFTVEGMTNALYKVRTTTTPAQHTAVVFQGVQDALTLSSSAQTSTVDGSVTFTGNVAPDKTGEPVYLQKLDSDGQWHTVKSSKVTTGSQYSFSWTFASAGTKQFRARILGDATNVGGASAPVSVLVSQPALSQLPTS